MIFLICALGLARSQFLLARDAPNCVNACLFDLVVGVLFVAAGSEMVYNEMKKKRCRHLDEVNRHQIPQPDACDRPLSGDYGRCFVAAVTASWRVVVAGGRDIWYVPLLLAVASALMTLGALRHRKTDMLKTRIDMKNNLMQLVRLVAMVLAVAGIIYAPRIHGARHCRVVWITLLGVGFVGLLYTFRLTQRRAARARREQERLERSAAAAGGAEVLRRTDFRGVWR